MAQLQKDDKKEKTVEIEAISRDSAVDSVPCAEPESYPTQLTDEVLIQDVLLFKKKVFILRFDFS